MRLVLVVNDTASAVTARTRQLVEDLLKERHDLTVRVTEARRHAWDLAREAADGGADAVVVLGGDGTVNEAANGLAGSDTALAALPGGSTNVFARTIGLPNRAVPAAQQVVEALDAGSIRRVGMGRAGERRFLFHIGIGFDAAVVEQVERRGELKRWLGPGLFAASALTTWLRHYDRRSPRFTVHLPGGEDLDGFFAICEETDPYTFLGPRPFKLAPGTGFDGGMSVVVLQDLSAATVVGAAAAALAGGERLGDRAWVEVRSGVESVRIDAPAPFPIQVDGDFLGQVTELDVVHEPDLLRLVVPVAAGAPAGS